MDESYGQSWVNVLAGLGRTLALNPSTTEKSKEKITIIR